MSEKAIHYLGQKLFALYKEKHNGVTQETIIQKVSQDEARYGMRLLKPQQYNVYEMLSMQASYEYIDIPSEKFETWAENPTGLRHWLTYVKEMDTIYVFSYVPRL